MSQLNKLKEYRSLCIEYHGPVLDDEGNPNSDFYEELHIRLWLGSHPAEGETYASGIFQLDTVEDLRREDGECSVCKPKRPIVNLYQNYTIADATKPCPGCGNPIQPKQFWVKKTGRHIGC